MSHCLEHRRGGRFLNRHSLSGALGTGEADMVHPLVDMSVFVMHRCLSSVFFPNLFGGVSLLSGLLASFLLIESVISWTSKKIFKFH